MATVVTRNQELAGAKVEEHITQAMLKKYLKAQRDLERLHKSFLASLKLGATVESGEITAYLDVGEDKRADYRGKLLQLCGEDALKEARNEAPLKPYERLRVEESKTKKRLS